MISEPITKAYSFCHEVRNFLYPG